MAEGGLFMRRGSNEPTCWYIIDPASSSMKTICFDKLPPWELLP